MFKPKASTHCLLGSWPSINARCPCRKSNPATHCLASGALWNYRHLSLSSFVLAKSATHKWHCQVLLFWTTAVAASEHLSGSKTKSVSWAFFWEQETPAMVLSLWAFSFYLNLQFYKGEPYMGLAFGIPTFLTVPVKSVRFLFNHCWCFLISMLLP